jgi:hypothetical protein
MIDLDALIANAKAAPQTFTVRYQKNLRYPAKKDPSATGYWPWPEVRGLYGVLPSDVVRTQHTDTHWVWVFAPRSVPRPSPSGTYEKDVNRELQAVLAATDTPTLVALTADHTEGNQSNTDRGRAFAKAHCPPALYARMAKKGWKYHWANVLYWANQELRSRPQSRPAVDIDLDRLIAQTRNQPPAQAPKKVDLDSLIAVAARRPHWTRQQVGGEIDWQTSVDPTYLATDLAMRVEAIAAAQHTLEQTPMSTVNRSKLQKAIRSQRQVVQAMLQEYSAIFGQDNAAEVAYAAGIGPRPDWLEDE